MPTTDFYVGYRDRAPRALARFMRRVVLALVLAGAGLAAALAMLQDPFDPGVFEFGVVRAFEGRIAERPYPTLVVDSPAVSDPGNRSGGAPPPPSGSFLLVAFGKHGADDEVRGYDGRHVTLRGSLVYRQGQQMIEIQPGSVAPASAVPAAAADVHSRPSDIDLGTMTLRGEIVDSKCFLGVMKPGRGKTHRACATRCISGGVPPILRVETAAGEFRDFLLTDQTGGEISDRILDFVAEPIEITGRVTRRGQLLVLAADPTAYRRL